jgi:hypothetical protein
MAIGLHPVTAVLLSKQSACNRFDPMIFEVPSVVSIQIMVFWVVMSCILADIYHNFGRPPAVISRIEGGILP